MMILEEEVLARKSYWDRSDETLVHMTNESMAVHSLVLSGGTDMNLPQIKVKLSTLKEQIKSLNQVLYLYH